MEIIGVILVAFIVFSWLFTLFDALSVPVHVWTAAGRNKALWILVILMFGLFGALAYWGSVQPQLKQAQDH